MAESPYTTKTYLELRAERDELKEQLQAKDAELVNWRREAVDQQERYLETKEQVQTLRDLNDRVIRERDEGHAENEKLNEQLEATQAALRGVIQNVEDSFQGGTFVDPVFIIARKILDGNPATESEVIKGMRGYIEDKQMRRNP